MYGDHMNDVRMLCGKRFDGMLTLIVEMKNRQTPLDMVPSKSLRDDLLKTEHSLVSIFELEYRSNMMYVWLGWRALSATLCLSVWTFRSCAVIVGSRS